MVEQGSEVVEINIEKHILLYLFKGDITHNLVVGQSCDAWEEGGGEGQRASFIESTTITINFTEGLHYMYLHAQDTVRLCTEWLNGPTILIHT